MRIPIHLILFEESYLLSEVLVSNVQLLLNTDRPLRLKQFCTKWQMRAFPKLVKIRD